MTAMFVNESKRMRNLKRGPSIDASYQDCVHLLKRVQRRGFFLEIYQPETRIAYGGHVLQWIKTK
jgi:hypothetical protein